MSFAAILVLSLAPGVWSLQVEDSGWLCDKFMGNVRKFIVSRRGDPGKSPFFVSCGSCASVLGRGIASPLQDRICAAKKFSDKFAYGFIN